MFVLKTYLCLHACINVHHMSVGVLRVQSRMPGPLELELQEVVVNCLIRELNLGTLEEQLVLLNS